MVRAPGAVERLLRSLRASTSRWISYSDGCSAMEANVMVEEKDVDVGSSSKAVSVTESNPDHHHKMGCGMLRGEEEAEPAGRTALAKDKP